MDGGVQMPLWAREEEEQGEEIDLDVPSFLRKQRSGKRGGLYRVWSRLLAAVKHIIAPFVALGGALFGSIRKLGKRKTMAPATVFPDVPSFLLRGEPPPLVMNGMTG